MSQQTKPSANPGSSAPSQSIAELLAGIRIPDLPYPVGQVEPGQAKDWRPLLQSCWSEQRDESVTSLLKSLELTWTVRQVNSAFLADRVMDAFLATSGLHPVLAAKVARLRFFLAWRLDQDCDAAFADSLRDWLDSLVEWRGWSDSGGRSARALLDQLEQMVVSVSACFEYSQMAPFEDFASQWDVDSQKRQEQITKLRQRLLVTEQGAARQRRADQTSRAVIGRALQGRQLPPPISEFIREHWCPLMRQVVWRNGIEGDDWKHASKLLEWLVWIGDPTLSERSLDRLYQVGEQIGDRILAVWQRVQERPLPQHALAGVEAVIVSRLRGETPALAPALDERFEFDLSWLGFQPPQEDQLTQVIQQWFVEGEGASEQRRYFFALLEDTCEVLWTNGAGVKLGLMPWRDFTAARQAGRLRPLPPLNRFQDVAGKTVTQLLGVFHQQRQQREKAACEARERAEMLRRKVEAAEARKREELAAREAERARAEAEEAAKRQAEEEAERERVERELTAAAQHAIDNLKLGGWIAIEPTPDHPEAVRLKLAVRLNATRKLVFVDRLGLNRTEYPEDDLVADIVAGRIRVLSSSAEFDDTLSRVVGRIRVGRN
ncbi:DUF1631 family protein [Marinobacter sp. CA1]|uniref:DUF1631 family protein n=1 Tax=Marinobacter sp. CA1 TaxID=2817656 RepID=UPI001D07273C|nr:DUF1631 family protein [Marinobacter sp. CA1]UDL07181.1 DUF1631 family protein [Marinobacter sp. CA1]